ncbi:glycosyltransferase family 4 protein [Natronorubrum thiooxidans]|uniref:Glycosyltransferase involved in cell wall bisynthesis n=1 Tax=Natronorubrum thiooxidans TaxID=308853 RepID=A0A1N7CK00_9EURY|nr:glycosyltransferase family 4 protein [Natronorubrum thiooxidans]SIR63978.1 Glycosyltransferase involved in cell wall bisynthesis [Natronorubrum thiooxidans]
MPDEENRMMKVATVYTGQSMSQPVLLNLLNKYRDIELTMFKGSADKIKLLNLTHEHRSYTVEDVKINGQTALWLTQRRLRKKWHEFLRENLDRSFDIVIGMNELATPAVEVADTYDIPSLFFIRNLETSGQEMYNPERGHIKNFRSADFGAKIQYPFFVENFRSYKRGMKMADEVIANSEYVSKRLKNDFNVDSEIIYPPIELDQYKVENDEDGYIGMVNPRNKEKGGDIFMNIVEDMPSEEFLAVGVFRDRELERRANSLDNLTHVGWCDNMRNFYKQTRMLLVPTQCNEAFGRVAAEAMVSGIPCVVSNRGGLPEVVGNTGEIVHEIESIDAWKDAIQQALTDHEPEAQMQRAKKFSAEKQGSKLNEVVEEIL